MIEAAAIDEISLWVRVRVQFFSAYTHRQEERRLTSRKGPSPEGLLLAGATEGR